MCSMMSFCLLLVFLILLGLVVVPDASLNNVLNEFITTPLNSTYYFRLYTNNATVSTSSVLGDFTEMTGGWYAAKNAPGGWTAAALNGHVSFTNGNNLVWTNSSGGSVTVYGVFVTDSAKTKLYYVEADPAAPVTVANGAQYVYTPNFQMKSIN